MKHTHTTKKHPTTAVTLALILAVTLALTPLLTGCATTTADPAADGVLTIVCTNFAGYDMTRAMLETYDDHGGSGEVKLVLLGKDGQDMHSFEPTAADIITLSAADLVIYTGAEQWLDAALTSAGNGDTVRISMMDACALISEEDHDHDHEHDHSHGEEDGSLISGDEHVWLSISNAIRIQDEIRMALCRVDPDNADAWKLSGSAYLTELLALQAEYETMMASAVQKTVVIADRHPFVYLFRDLGITCVAAFPGCSSETSASFATQTELIEAVREQGLQYIFIIEGSDGKVAEVVAAETGAEVLTLHSLQVVTDRSITYLNTMKQNLESLKKALQ